ncbi:protein KASH5-like [Pygocentrus nattereri]|uniref:protein KASH5-like n=1 Tax=Pygocentrus nattereri TaxID=42514 RepID=UPI001890E7AE|nr:protein KASH5-like [Pygocentrus nattereri]
MPHDRHRRTGHPPRRGRRGPGQQPQDARTPLAQPPHRRPTPRPSREQETVVMDSVNFNGGLRFPGDFAEDSEPTSLPHHPKAQKSDHHGYSAPSLSTDSGTCSLEPSQMYDLSETFRPDNRDLCELDMNGFSEEELLNITFEACDTTSQGEVLASTVVQYLQAMTGHSHCQDKLTVLQRMLDPEDQDALISRDNFHTTMRKWIAQCSQDRLSDDNYQASGSDLCKAAGSGTEYSSLLTETMFTDRAECHCESNDLLGLVAELKHAQNRLSGQNSSLLKTVSQCEEANLQLSLEVSELRSKLASAQLCVVRARSLSDELDEARRALRENQDRATKAQTNSHALMKESEHLKAHIKAIEEKNEKLMFEQSCAEDRLNKLKRANTDMKEELDETRVLLAVKEREITKKNIALLKLKDTYLEHHKIIEVLHSLHSCCTLIILCSAHTASLQSDLMRLQEHSQQALLRFDKCALGPPGMKRAAFPNHYSLHHEIMEAQPLFN